MALALYRRYRPESFADVIGQEHVTEPLMQALRTGRVGHAYLFSGPRGCGKTTSARILARCLNCEQGPTPTPCGTCDSCVALARGGPGHVDVIEIDAASHGGVDDARDLRERASYGPAQSRYKVYIIDEAHMVSSQGFNALLKIVEEPPEHVKFIFATTEPEKVIGTIRSRTHHYPFRLVPPAALTTYLERLLDSEQVAVEPGVLTFESRAGGGSVRDSLSVLDQLIAGSGPEGLTYAGAVSLLGFTDGELLDATIDALAAGDGAATFRQVDKVIESGHDPRRFVEDLLERLRDLIIVAAVPDGVGQVLRGVPEDQLERMRVQQAAFGAGALSRAADIVNTGLTEMTGATSPRLQLELICARILLPAASGEQGYAARLDRLERRLEVGGGVPSTPQYAPGTPPVGMPLSSPPRAPSTTSAPAPVSSSERSAPDAPPATSTPASTPTSTPTSAPSSGPAVHRPAQSSDPGIHSHRGGEPVDEGITRGDTASNAPSVAPAAGPAPSGGLDTDAIRRAWPDVLGRVFQMRRITWTFVSQNAQVVRYDGRTLTLGIATEGLTTTFRAGNHAEVVRQALIDQLGIDAVVDGIHVSDGSIQQTAPGPPPGSFPSSDASTSDGGAPTGDAPSAADPGPPSAQAASQRPGTAGSEAGSPPARRAPSAMADAGLSPAAGGRSLEENAGWGSVSGPAPDWATAGPPPVGTAPTTAPSTAAPSTAAPSTAAPLTAPTVSQPKTQNQPKPQNTATGASAVRASLDAARRSPHVGAATEAPPRSLTDDSAVSRDDEVIEVSTDVGRAVIEKVLGGRVVQEFND
jgi:DNA polymerase-3 subunit gamma/tau